jgi:hypothetical protein
VGDIKCPDERLEVSEICVTKVAETNREEKVEHRTVSQEGEALYRQQLLPCNTKKTQRVRGLASATRPCCGSRLFRQPWPRFHDQHQRRRWNASSSCLVICDRKAYQTVWPVAQVLAAVGQLLPYALGKSWGWLVPACWCWNSDIDGGFLVDGNIYAYLRLSLVS